MKKRLDVVVMSLALLVGGAVAVAQEKPSLKLTRVNGKVWVVEGQGGNVGVFAGEDGILLVDDKFEPLAKELEKRVVPLSTAPLRYVLNTHWHGDHTGANVVFGRQVPIIAHAQVRERLSKGAERGDRTIAPAPKEALPVITYEDGITLHLNGERVRVAHAPSGHTDGDSVVYFEGSNVVHLGDQFFNGHFPFVDLDSGGNVQGLIASLSKIRSELPANVKIIPGHGPVAEVKELDAYLAMLKDAVARVRKAKAEGKTVQQMQQEKVLKGLERWSWNFIPTDKFIETVALSLDKERS